MQIPRLPRVLVVAGALFLAWAAPAGATPSHPGGIVDTCPEILRGRPTGNLEKATLPADGSVVHAGEKVAVTLRWDQGDFSGAQLHKALDCVTVNGELSEALSVLRRDPANDGTFEHSFVVPPDLNPGSRLCDRGFVSGPGSVGDFDGHKSNDVCFDVAAPSGGPPGSTPVASPATASGPAPPPITASSPPAGASSPEGGPPAPPTADIAAPVVPADTVHGVPPTPPVTSDLRPDHPHVDVGPIAAVKGAIPVTGRTEQPYVLFAGAALALGGLAMVGSARRPAPPVERAATSAFRTLARRATGDHR
jgi:hypothetical protein